MKRLTLLIFILTVSLISMNAQNKKELDQKSIKEMCGCYEVTFEYAETFPSDTLYEKHDNYKANALEWVELITDKSDELSLQHLLVINDTMVIKHWRQDWIYEDTSVFNFEEKNTWKVNKYSKDSVKEQWSQKVYQVDDSPRYAGIATWVHVDGKDFWENKTDAPLPRREYSKRHDYNVMGRRNTVRIEDYGWLHEQDNDKIIRNPEAPDTILVKEKGLNTYVKVDDSKCIVAKKWWEENQKVWKKVVKEWNRVFEENETVKLKSKVDDKRLYQYLFALDNSASSKEIRNIINKFLEH